MIARKHMFAGSFELKRASEKSFNRIPVNRS